MKQTIIGLFTIMMVITILIIIISYQERETKAVVTYNQIKMLTNQNQILINQVKMITIQNTTNDLLIKILNKMN